MSNSIGIMQGRLSPPVNGQIQAFPWESWRDEFSTAADLGFNEIEFIFEAPNHESNPLLSSDGRSEIKRLSRHTGVTVRYICADYFMQRPFIRVPEETRKESVAVLKRLIRQGSEIGIRGIEVPMVDNSRIETPQEATVFVECLQECLPVAESCGVRLGLETSLSPDDFKALLGRIGHPLVEANYDTGNSASLGYNPQEEISRLGSWIGNVHIKDRVLGGGTVPLGMGDADFDLVFQSLGKVCYRGSFILQAARGEDDVATAREYLTFVKSYLQKYLGGEVAPVGHGTE